jgi:hypothetical protein
MKRRCIRILQAPLAIKATSKNLFHVSAKRNKLYKIHFEHSAYFGFAQHSAIRRILRYTAATFNMAQFRQGLIPPFECRRGMTNALLQNLLQEGICGKSQSRSVGYALLRLRWFRLRSTTTATASICLVTSTPLSTPLRRIQLSRNIKQVFGTGLKNEGIWLVMLNHLYSLYIRSYTCT